jgi:hypothetical protein
MLPKKKGWGWGKEDKIHVGNHRRAVREKQPRNIQDPDMV